MIFDERRAIKQLYLTLLVLAAALLIWSMMPDSPAALDAKPVVTANQTPGITPTPGPTIVSSPTRTAPVQNVKMPAPIPKNVPPQNYTLSSLLTENTTANSSDVIVSLSFHAPSMTLSCSGFQNTSLPLITTQKGVLFEFDNTSCQARQPAYAAYALPSGARENISMLMSYSQREFGLNFTD